MSSLIRAALALILTSSPLRLSAFPLRPPSPPNVVVFLADDMGYSDLGCYGGEVRTPNLDRLAREGLRFTQFYNTARCWPTRAALLTGYYAQQVRRDTLPGVLQNGTEGKRPAWAKLLPDYLRPLGYRSYHSGKWHLDSKPIAAGFDRSYWLEDTDRFFSPKVHFEDDRQLPPVEPDSGYYAATRIAQHAIDCLKDHAEHHRDQPFFSYVAFISPHFPLQAPAEDVARYRNRFRDGWDRLRERRLARMKELGIVDCALSERTAGVPAWDTLTREQQAEWQSRMAVHAAMVDRMDQEIGRVVDQLRKMGALDDTVIFFLSDNGASAEKVLRGDGDDPTAPPGSARSFRCLEPGWANLANAPLRYTKMFVHEGGISTSLIVHWPHGLQARGEIRRNAGHVIDLAPTILDLASSGTPTDDDRRMTDDDRRMTEERSSEFRDLSSESPGAAARRSSSVIRHHSPDDQSEIQNPRPLWPGRSLWPALIRDGSVDHADLWWFHAGNRALRVGDWKIVSHGKDPWELYDLSTDRSEMHDLSSQYPERVREMARAWNARLEEFKRDAAPGQG